MSSLSAASTPVEPAPIVLEPSIAEVETEQSQRLRSGESVPGQGTSASLSQPAVEDTRNMHEKLRGLPVPEQIKLAKNGDISVRSTLERIYGKSVWEPILRNPRVSTAEVARISRMGNLPQPLVDLIQVPMKIFLHNH